MTRVLTAALSASLPETSRLTAALYGACATQTATSRLTAASREILQATRALTAALSASQKVTW